VHDVGANVGNVLALGLLETVGEEVGDVVGAIVGQA